jgi:hypothetical protein
VGDNNDNFDELTNCVSNAGFTYACSHFNKETLKNQKEPTVINFHISKIGQL